MALTRHPDPDPPVRIPEFKLRDFTDLSYAYANLWRQEDGKVFMNPEETSYFTIINELFDSLTVNATTVEGFFRSAHQHHHSRWQAAT
jgi:hypothetical protein